MTHEEIYNKFCEWSPGHARMVTKWKPWGSTSIVVWLTSGHKYKCKLYDGDKFIMQPVSNADIERKLGTCQ